MKILDFFDLNYSIDKDLVDLNNVKNTINLTLSSTFFVGYEQYLQTNVISHNITPYLTIDLIS